VRSVRDVSANLLLPAHFYSHMSYSRFRLFTGGLCCFLFVALFAGCATRIQTGDRQAPNANFARRSTFRFLPDKSQAASEAVSNTSYWRGEIGQDLLSAMNAKGYRFFPNRKTDLLVAFHIVLVENEAVTTLNNYSGYDLTANQAAQADLAQFQNPKRPGAVSKGILIIDFIDPTKKQLLWRGWAEAEFDRTPPGPSLKKLAKSAVDQLLAKFPSRR
jgi:uncharacterized protein DUF4136